MISKINLRNFRRFKTLNLDITSKNIIFEGANATGKTSILEAIYLISITKSIRSKNLAEAITTNAPFSEIKILNDGKQFKMVLSEKGKLVTYNNNEVKKLSNYIGLMPAVFFSPQDLNLIYGSPTLRRQFLNQEISQLNEKYLNDLQEYNRFLKERNALLKTLKDFKQSEVILKVVTEELIEVGNKLIKARKEFIDNLNLIINDSMQVLSDSKEVVKLVYEPSVTEEDFSDALKKSLQTDLIQGITSKGPHRDEIIILINGKEALKYASQGQIRSIILSLKISLCKLIFKITKKEPILLLDDVLNELDIKRQNRLLSLILNLGQIFITTVDTSSCFKENLSKYQIIKL